MNMNRNRPPKDCEDLALWFSGTVNDAIRDCREAGLDEREMAHMLLSLARTCKGVMPREEWEKSARYIP